HGKPASCAATSRFIAIMSHNMFYYTHISQEIKHFFQNISAMRQKGTKEASQVHLRKLYCPFLTYGAMP
ncbi:MAG TPA: hypothetical protein H9849_02920, partial [Candidatus Anaerobutyricum stercoripullorum]|nr:hypothetical protein [Candidatus Anaerobutyricum stercoripullorum]